MCSAVTASVLIRRSSPPRHPQAIRGHDTGTHRSPATPACQRGEQKEGRVADGSPAVLNFLIYFTAKRTEVERDGSKQLGKGVGWGGGFGYGQKGEEGREGGGGASDVAVGATALDTHEGD